MKEDIDLKILPSKTYDVLDTLLKIDDLLNNFVLAGGTALSLFFKHRKSEDLDFLTFKKNSFDKTKIINNIMQLSKIKLINESKDQIDLILNNVKITFYDSQYEFLSREEFIKIGNLNIVSINALIALKVQVLFLRARYRDYFDLYFLIKKLGINNVFKIANSYFPQLTEKIFHIALLYIDDIEEDSIIHLEPIEDITKDKIQKYFESEIKKIVR